MRTPRLPLLAAFAALNLLVSVRAAEAPAPAGNPLYVRIETSDPIYFDRLRYAVTNGDELVLSTLKATAAEQARFAGYTGEVVVLDEKARAPDGALVLVLSWDGKSVFANVGQGGKDKYLGVVNRLPLSYHPDYNRMRRSIDQAGLQDARRDATLRAEVQMELYLALKYLVKYQQTGS